MPRVFVKGATGFMGRQLTRELIRRGHFVKALARPGSAPGTFSVLAANGRASFSRCIGF